MSSKNSSSPSDPLQLAIQIAVVLEQASIPYALGGALAYGIWSAPRATADVDINVFIDIENLTPLFDALNSIGIDAERAIAKRDAEAQGMFILYKNDIRIDLFIPSIDFAWEAATTSVRRKVDGHDLCFLSAESLCVFKLLFFRLKDLADLQRLVAIRGEQLDVGYVRRKIVEMMGDDERLATWDKFVALYGKNR